MAFCSKCGAEIKDGEKFCSSCGAPAPEGQTASNAGNTGATDANAGANNTGANASSFVDDAKKKAQAVFNTKDNSAEYDKSEIDANKIVCMLAYIPILFFLPLVLCPKGSKYAKFHANQGLLLLIVCIILNIVGAVLLFVPILGALIMMIFNKKNHTKSL